MPRLVLGLWPDIQDHNIAPREHLGQRLRRHLLHIAALSQVVLGQDGHLGHMPRGHVAHGRPQVRHPLARQAVHDPRSIPSRANQPRPSQQPQVMRRIGKRLANLLGDLVHRPLALRQHVHDLRPPSAPKRMPDRGKRVKQGVLRMAITHRRIKLSFDYLNVKDPGYLQAARWPSAGRAGRPARTACGGASRPSRLALPPEVLESALEPRGGGVVDEQPVIHIG